MSTEIFLPKVELSTYEPTGNLTASNVQDAIDQLEVQLLKDY